MKNNYYTATQPIQIYKIKYNRYAYQFSNIKIPLNIYMCHILMLLYKLILSIVYMLEIKARNIT